MGKEEYRVNFEKNSKKVCPILDTFRGDWPMICYTYFEANDFSGKKLIPFSTHEGSGLAGFDTKLGKAADGADVLTGLAIQGEDAQNNQNDVREDVKDWISGLGL